MQWIRVFASIVAVLTSCAALAQQPLYGPPISADDAKKVAAAALAEAKKNNFNMAVSVVDSTMAPDCAENDSAWITDCAGTPPPVGDGEGVGDGVGDGVPPLPARVWTVT